MYHYPSAVMLRTVQLYLLLAACVRGIDYMARPPSSVTALYYIESSAPLLTWGAIFLGCGVLGLAGEAWLQWGKADFRWIPSWMAHSGLVCLYTAFSISVLISVLNQGWGISGPFEWLGYAIANLVFVGRRKHVPAV